MITFPTFVSLLAACVLSTQVASGLDAKIGVHDPSSIIKCDGSYYLFGTGRGISILTSKDAITWERSGRVFERIPETVKSYVPKNDGVDVWAPEIIHLNGQYLLYYSVSTWGAVPSAIGLVTSPTLNPKAPNYKWTDRGMIVHSAEGQHFNAIDPGIVQGPDGRLWLCYGSYLGTIELVELNPKTGLRISAKSPVVSIASQSEAANLIYRNGFYYLFANHGTCCAGVKSTYHILVGRAKNVTGPYLDRDGDDLKLGAGTMFLASSNGKIGPGHFSRFSDNGVEKFSIHYEGELGVRRPPFLAILPLFWSSDGWPVADQDIKAKTHRITP